MGVGGGAGGGAREPTRGTVPPQKGVLVAREAETVAAVVAPAHGGEFEGGDKSGDDEHDHDDGHEIHLGRATTRPGSQPRHGARRVARARSPFASIWRAATSKPTADQF